MKRIDLLNGVLCLTITLLSPFLLQINGYLDLQTYDAIKHDNSFYGESIEPIRAYLYYKYFLNGAYLLLFFTLIGLACEPTMRRLSRFQIQCYRPYYLYHCAVCLIPFVIRYANMTAMTSDVIMVQLDWTQFFYIKTSILRFILSVFLSFIRKYETWRLLLYVLVSVIHACVLTYILSTLCIDCAELLDNLRRNKGDFLTTWSHGDHEQVNPSNISVKENHIVKYFHLNQSLFRKTGQKQYRTESIDALHHQTDQKGTEFPYHRTAIVVAKGESIELNCSAGWKTNNPISVLWFVNGSYLDLNMYMYDQETNITEDNEYHLVSSKLKVDFIENFGFGDYTCFFRKYNFHGEKVSFASKNAMTILRSAEVLFGQYSVQQYMGRDFYLYATPGGALDLMWKHMNFDNENEDVIQYYLVNGKHFKRQNENTLTSRTCSTLSYFYILYGMAMDWFFVPYLSSSSDVLVNVLNLYQTRFVECAGSSVFGVHTVEYFRRVYDKKSQAFVLREVKHPDTIYVLPDLPYFYKMDNATKEEKTTKIKHLQELKLNPAWFEKSDTYVLFARVVFEVFFVFFVLLLLLCSLSRLWDVYKRFVIWPLRRKILGQPLYADQCLVKESKFSYSCYTFCSDADKELVYNNIVHPLRNENISTGFIFEESDLNRCGKSIFDIQCDLFMRSEHLIFFITSKYLEEIEFSDIYRERVLGCIQSNILPANRVLFIFADNCELPDKLRYCLPEASDNIHDWVVSTNFEERYRCILEWIKNRKENKKSERVVSTIFVGQSATFFV